MGVSGVGSDPAFASSLLQGLPSLGLGFLTGKTRVTIRTGECNSAGRAGRPQALRKQDASVLLQNQQAREPPL